MNQILEPEEKNNIEISVIEKKKSFHRIYKIQFFVFSIIAFILLCLLFMRLYSQNQKENLSKRLLNNYNISKIYANELGYTTQLNNSETSDSYVPFVIGMIKIDKINLNYPILSKTTNELLEISLCRFAGPMPNEIGNLCIAGHNYVDYKLFSRLNELNIGDTIKIYDLRGNKVDYAVSKKYETSANDTSCTFQNTDGKKILTLLTCNNVNGKRLVVVAK